MCAFCPSKELGFVRVKSVVFLSSTDVLYLQKQLVPHFSVDEQNMDCSCITFFSS